ncbi:MAG: ATP synthase F0 subunit B [Planctomycetes bacterium]|nr:ATP synthase F0 subunit B [Planctomycetota bacterium]MCW8136874.1 ATP synthase F0 subunit B [Planctomycetota bacterium]
MRLRDLMVLALCCAAPLAAAGGEPSQHEVLHFSANLMFWEYVTFGIIFLVLGVKVIPIMLTQLGARQERIKDALDKADQVRAEAEVLLKKHEEMMRNAHADAKKITDEATVAAREAAAKITADAEAAARETRDRAQRELDQMRRKAEAELRESAIELALLAGGRVLEKSLTGEDHRRLAREAIEASTLMKN